MSEAQLQRAVAKVLDHAGLCWCHVPNGGNRDIRTGAKLKAEGVKRGVPDVLIFDAPCFDVNTVPQWFGLAIELKIKGNKPTPEQIDWHEELMLRYWRVKVCYTLDEVLALLRECYPSKFP